MRYAVALLALIALPLRAQQPLVPTVAVPALISSGTATTSASTGAAVTLFSASVPPNVLSAPPSLAFATSLRIFASGHVANNVNVKVVRIVFGGVVMDTMTVTASSANFWAFDCKLTFRTAGPGTGAQAYLCEGFQGNTTPSQPLGGSTISIDPTVTNALAITVNQTAGSDITLDNLIAEVVQ